MFTGVAIQMVKQSYCKEKKNHLRNTYGSGEKEPYKKSVLNNGWKENVKPKIEN